MRGVEAGTKCGRPGRARCRRCWVQAREEGNGGGRHTCSASLGSSSSGSSSEYMVQEAPWEKKSFFKLLIRFPLAQFTPLAHSLGYGFSPFFFFCLCSFSCARVRSGGWNGTWYAVCCIWCCWVSPRFMRARRDGSGSCSHRIQAGAAQPSTKPELGLTSVDDHGQPHRRLVPRCSEDVIEGAPFL